MHHFIPMPGQESALSPIDPAHTAAIRRWAAEALHLPEDAVVTVTETGCVDPGCPIVETVVAVFDDGPTRSWKFTRPRVAVTRLMVFQALQSGRPQA